MMVGYLRRLLYREKGGGFFPLDPYYCLRPLLLPLNLLPDSLSLLVSRYKRQRERALKKFEQVARKARHCKEINF